MAKYKVGDTVYAPYVDLENELIRVESGHIEDVDDADKDAVWYYVWDSYWLENELCSSYKEAADCCKARYKAHLRALKRQIDQL